MKECELEEGGIMASCHTAASPCGGQQCHLHSGEIHEKTHLNNLMFWQKRKYQFGLVPLILEVNRQTALKIKPHHIIRGGGGKGGGSAISTYPSL